MKLTMVLEFFQLQMHKRPIVTFIPAQTLVKRLEDTKPHQLWPVKKRRQTAPAAHPPAGRGKAGRAAGRGRKGRKGGGKGRGAAPDVALEPLEDAPAAGEAEAVAEAPDAEEIRGSEPEEGAESEDEKSKVIEDAVKAT